LRTIGAILGERGKLVGEADAKNKPALRRAVYARAAGAGVR
jgi:hypothetical protein